MQWLKQSTAITLKIGPFLDETDGKTAETGLTIAQADVRLSKNGGDIAQKNEATSCTHDELGIYGCPINTTDTATLGRLQLFVHESGALPVWHEFMVVPANVWDSMFGADMLKVDVHAIDDDETAADNLESYCDGTTPQPVNATQISADATAADNLELITEIANITSLTVDAAGHLECDVVEIEGGDPTDAINAAVDTALDTAIPGSPTAHSINERIKAIDDLTQASGSGDLAAILGDTNELQTDDIPGAISGLNDPTAAAVADAVWDELSTGHVSAGKAGQQLWTDLDAVLADTGELQTDDVPGLISGLNDPTAAAVADAVWDEASTGHVDAGKAGQQLWTDIDAVLTDTGELQTDDVPGLISGLNDPTAASIADAVWDEASTGHVDAGKAGQQLWTDIDAVLTDTGELQTDWANGGRLDLLIDAIKAVTDALPDSGALNDLATILADTNELQTDDVPGLIAALNNISTAQVNTEVDNALTDIHLDHLLAANYDPAAKPGVATALLNEIVENDGGVSRFTTNALEQAPSGGGAGSLDLDESLASHDTEDTLGNVLNDLVEESDGVYRFTAAALQSTLGAGAITFTYTLTSSVDSSPIASATVWVTTDQAGSNVVASGTTDTNGAVTFYLDAGTYYIFREKSGWNFSPNPDTEVVS